MVDEIENSIRNLEKVGDGAFSAAIVFGRDFTGFKGHFPGRPVLPGVCQILALSVLAGKALKRNLRLTEVSRAKFLSVVEPDEETSFEFSLSGNPDSTVLNGTVRVKDKGVVGKFKLVFGDGNG
jgi:3-hydroxyacyl-[acyl-carrier-protein] dehydratase